MYIKALTTVSWQGCSEAGIDAPRDLIQAQLQIEFTFCLALCVSYINAFVLIATVRQRILTYSDVIKPARSAGARRAAARSAGF